MSTENFSRSQYFPPTSVASDDSASIASEAAALPEMTDAMLPALSSPFMATVLPAGSASLPALVEGGGIRVARASKTANILLIVDNEPDENGAHSAHRVRRLLAESGQGVTMCSREHWRGVLEINEPEIIILDVAQRPNDTRALCREVKSECEGQGITIVVALPEVVDERAQIEPRAQASNQWEFWQSAGADALLEADSSGHLEAQLQLWTRYARLQREHLVMGDKLSKQVQTDDLTQVLNRRFFFQLAHSEIKRARRYGHELACLMVDIDHFKLFNKTFGYACGDAILRGVAQTIRSWTRDSDVVARFGAKKFAILLPETSVDGAMQLHEKLQRAIEEQEFLWQNMPLPVSISIGEAERKRDSARITPELSQPATESSAAYEEPLSIREELADLLEDADAALYVAKKGVRYPNLFPAIDRDHEIIGVLGSM